MGKRKETSESLLRPSSGLEMKGLHRSVSYGGMSVDWEGDDWTLPGDLDKFFKDVYMYYSERGFDCILVARLSNLLTLGFTILFSSFLLLYVDWHQVLHCSTQEACNDLNPIRTQPFHAIGFGGALTIVYFILFSLLWLAHLLDTVSSIRKAFEMRFFFNRILGISETKVKTVQWSKVTETIEQLQERIKVSHVKDHSSLDIASRIMRRDNYLIAMLNAGILPVSDEVSVFGSIKIPLAVFGTSFEYAVRMLVLNSMFTDQFSLSPLFLDESMALKRNFRILGIINLAFLPFILLFLTVFLFLKHFESFYSNRSDLISGGRTQFWTVYAQWFLRGFNELPHTFMNRMDSSKSHELAQKYILQFPYYVRATFFRFIGFVSGSFVAVLLVILIFGDSAILSNLEVFGQSLLWYLAVFSAVLAISRTFSVAEQPSCDPEQIMLDLFDCTLYFPDTWRGNCHQQFVLDEFKTLYRPRIVLLMQELISVVMTPFYLIFHMPDKAEDILAFIRDHTDYVDGIGDVCSFAQFDLARHGNREYNPLVSELQPKSTTRHGKLETSVITFALEYPQWKGDSQVRQLMQMVDQRSLSGSDALLQMRFSKMLPQSMNASTFKHNGNLSPFQSLLLSHEVEESKNDVKLQMR